MSVHKVSVKCRLSYLLLVIIIGMVIIMLSVLSQLRKHIGEISEYKGKEQANRIIAETIENKIDKFSDTEFLDIIRDDSGRIISAEVNSAEVNKVKNELVSQINDRLCKAENESVEIPIGTLTGVTYFTGRGFNLNLRLHQIGSVKSEMKSTFESAGINQTKFRLYIEISVYMKAVLPFNTQEISVTEEYLVSESVIVGEVPEMYISK